MLAAISVGLDPVMNWIYRQHFYIRSQLTFARVPSDWHELVLASLWFVLLAIVYRLLPGWLRVLLLLGTVLLVAKAGGYLPRTAG